MEPAIKEISELAARHALTIMQLRAMLKRHHDWHMSRDVYHVAAYDESSLCAETRVALGIDEADAP